jgi:hypothetical protein
MAIPKSAVLGVLSIGVSLAPVVAHAQDTQQQVRAADTELVFEREVFQYPSFTRRNPFIPLEGVQGGGPRFEQLSLIGIIYSPDPGLGLATLSTGGVQVAEDGTTSPVEGESYNLKVGESVGNTTVVEIRRDAVIVDVEVFDEVERITMNFVSRREGGTP